MRYYSLILTHYAQDERWKLFLPLRAGKVYGPLSFLGVSEKGEGSFP